MVLRQILFGAIFQLGNCIIQGFAAGSNHLFEQRRRRILMVDNHCTLRENRAMVHLLVQAENRHTRFGKPIGNSSLDRSRTAILREQAAMYVHSAKARHAEDVLRQDGVSDNDKKVCIELAEVRLEFRGMQVQRLQHRQPVILGGHLHRRGCQHAPTTGRPIRLSHDSKNFVIGCNKMLQEMCRKIRRTHKNNLHETKYRKCTAPNG